MAKFEISQADQGHAHTEAALYAEGTTWTADELYAEWMAACEKAGERVSPQRVFSEVLAEKSATYYVIRWGYNAANQSSMRRTANPQNDFESGRAQLVAIVEARSESAAKAAAGVTVYIGQFLSAVTNPRAVKGLTDAIRDFQNQ